MKWREKDFCVLPQWFSLFFFRYFMVTFKHRLVSVSFIVIVMKERPTLLMHRNE